MHDLEFPCIIKSYSSRRTTYLPLTLLTYGDLLYKLLLRYLWHKSISRLQQQQEQKSDFTSCIIVAFFFYERRLRDIAKPPHNQSIIIINHNPLHCNTTTYYIHLVDWISQNVVLDGAWIQSCVIYCFIAYHYLG